MGILHAAVMLIIFLFNDFREHFPNLLRRHAAGTNAYNDVAIKNANNVSDKTIKI